MYDGRTAWGLVFVALLLFGVVVQSGAMGSLFYSERVYTSHRLSTGFEVEDHVYFLSEYRLFRMPRGIARFPDGGQARRLYQATHLYRFCSESEELQQLIQLADNHQPGHNVQSAYFEADADVLRFIHTVRSGTREQVDTWQAAAWHMRQNREEPLSAESKAELLSRLHYDQENPWKPSALRKALRNMTITDWKLPSPLAYLDQTDNQYANDLIALRGDQAHRNAIIEEIAAGRIDADPRDVLRRMEERADSLEEPARSAYGLFGRDTVDALRAIR